MRVSKLDRGGIIKYPVYRVKNVSRLFGFEDPIEDVPIGNQNLRTLQDNILSDLGITAKDVDSEDLIPDEQYLIFNNDLFFSKNFFKKVQNSIDGMYSLSFYFEENTFNQRFLLPIDGADKRLSPPIFFRSKKNKELKKVLIHQNVYEFSLRIPSQIIKNNLWHYDQCDTYAGTIYTPFHLLQLNLAYNFERFVKLNIFCPEWFKKRFVKRGSRLFNWSLRSVNKIHKSARIHPSAVIEGCTIGANVEIGANSVVKGSIIGEGTTIEDCVVCNYCVLGKNNYLSSSNFINLCMTYDDVYLIHGPYQFSIYGRNVAAMAVINCDFRLDQKGIKIDSPSGVIDSGQTLLGIAYGHESVVGGGNILAPGRTVPANFKQPPPKFIISEFKT